MTPFGEWLNRHGISYADAGRALGITRAYVQLLAVGKATPQLKVLGAKIEAWTAQLDPEDTVPVASWLPFIPKFAGLKLA